jgi:hypothetical protein
MVDHQLQTHRLRFGMVLLDKPVSTWALREHRNEPIIYLERMMMSLMAIVTDRTNWQNEDITEVFHDLLAHRKANGIFPNVTGYDNHAVFDYNAFTSAMAIHVRMIGFHQIYKADGAGRKCVSELHDCRELQQQYGFIPALDSGRSTILKADSLVPPKIKYSLVNAAAVLEDIALQHRDWRPDTHATLLDVVDPSLYCFVKGRSEVFQSKKHTNYRVPRYNGESCVSETRPVSGLYPESRKTTELDPETYADAELYQDTQRARRIHDFSLLPCEVKINERGIAYVRSYINNVHPYFHKALYSCVESVLTAVLPTWSKTLHILTSSQERPRRFEYARPNSSNVKGSRRPDPQEHELSDEFRAQKDRAWLSEYYTAWNMPQCKPYGGRAKGWGLDPSCREDNVIEDLRHQYADRGLQVLVRLFSILLTPEQPCLDDEQWHQEGWQNDHVCACTYYCYDSKNVTTRMDFREALDTTDSNNQENDTLEHDFTSEFYNIQDGDAALQELGQVRLPQGRVVTFPNVIYHRLSRVELQNKTRPGHAEIMVVSLVDPNMRVLSTANIPPQQHDWWANMAKRHPRVDPLPVELQDQVVEPVDDGLLPIFDLTQARALREEFRSQQKISRRTLETALHAHERRIHYEQQFEFARFRERDRAMRREKFGLPELKQDYRRIMEPKVSPYAAFRRNEGLEELKAARVQAEAAAIARGDTGWFTEEECEEIFRTRHLREPDEFYGGDEAGTTNDNDDVDDDDDDMDDADYETSEDDTSEDDTDVDISESDDEEISDMDSET